MFRAIRIFLLLFLLAFVSYTTYRSKTQSVEWKYTLPVNIYPINGDGSAAAETYIRNLTLDEFQPIADFMRESANHYGKAANASIEIRLQPVLKSGPPAPPEERSGLSVIWWSLKFRWWAFRNAKMFGPGPQVRLFVQYFDPATLQVHESTALQEGLIGRVNVFAASDMRNKNNVVIAHEFLHTLGATDKYDLSNDMPVFPEGYGEPDLQPVYPQKFAEIMGGRLVLSSTEIAIPRGFREVVIGRKTAEEINFLPKTN
jgi:hypothetical protein